MRKFKSRRLVTMRQTKFTIDQIIKILAEADLLVSSVSQVARKYNVFPNTIYR